MTDIQWLLPVPDPNWALFLDVDGTLIDIAPAPSSVTIPKDLPEILADLAHVLDDAVALVSGRTIDDLDRLLAPLRLTLAGQHGAELRWPDGRAEHCGAGNDGLSRLLPPIRRFALAKPGILVEDKGRTVAVHCRLAPQYEDDIAEFLARVVERERAPFDIVAGHLVLELKPRGVSKGTAVERLLGSAPFLGRLPVFIGDDTTDEDGFAAVRGLGGHGIRVGLTGHSVADYRLPDPPAVRQFLTGVISRLTPTAKRKSHADS